MARQISQTVERVRKEIKELGYSNPNLLLTGSRADPVKRPRPGSDVDILWVVDHVDPRRMAELESLLTGKVDNCGADVTVVGVDQIEGGGLFASAFGRLVKGLK